MTDQPLLIALVAVQFTIHTLGWAMAAYLTNRWRLAEGHFAGHWLLIAAGLLLYVPPWASGSLPRNMANLLIIGALALQHRGMSLYWGQRPADRGYAVLLGAATLAIAGSLLQEHGHGLRVAVVCVGVGTLLVATVGLLWRRGRATMPRFTVVVCGGYSVLALALFARAVQALSVDAQTKISIDAPGHSNVPLAILVMFIGGLINLAQIRLVLGRVFAHLTAQAHSDALTGALNRRGFMRAAEEVHARAATQGGHGYAVLMVDVDHFKVVNDTHGHAEGDHVLKRVAQCLRDGLRVGEIVGRWGGEEFCVLLPRTKLAEAQALAERITLRMAATGTPRVTVSIGVAEAHAQAETVDEVIRRADGALYRAKETGRNRVVVAPQGAAQGTAGAMPA